MTRTALSASYESVIAQSSREQTEIFFCEYSLESTREGVLYWVRTHTLPIKISCYINEHTYLSPRDISLNVEGLFDLITTYDFPQIRKREIPKGEKVKCLVNLDKGLVLTYLEYYSEQQGVFIYNGVILRLIFYPYFVDKLPEVSLLVNSAGTFLSLANKLGYPVYLAHASPNRRIEKFLVYGVLSTTVLALSQNFTVARETSYTKNGRRVANRHTAIPLLDRAYLYMVGLTADEAYLVTKTLQDISLEGRIGIMSDLSVIDAQRSHSASGLTAHLQLIPELIVSYNKLVHWEFYNELLDGVALRLWFQPNMREDTEVLGFDKDTPLSVTSGYQWSNLDRATMIKPL